MALQPSPLEKPPPTQLPDWGVSRSYNSAPSHQNTPKSLRNPLPRLRARALLLLDRRLPPHRTYLGRSRRTFLLLLLLSFLLLLGLVIGLAVALSPRSSAKNLFLPLPTDRSSFTGDLTYYGTGLGACGITSTDSDNICAVSHFLFDAQARGSNPNNNPLCGLKIRAERFDELVGAMRSVDLTVVDRCVGCAPTDIDVTTGAFNQLADPAKGRVKVTWAWLTTAQ